MAFVRFLLVFFGAGFGGVLRWVLSRWLNSGFPVGTLLVNVLGCLLIGVLTGVSNRYWPSSDNMRLLLVVGFCGGFTTFSTFVNETFGMLSFSHVALAVGYAALSLFLGLLALWLGQNVFQ